MKPAGGRAKSPYRVAIDTGGTFTDAVGILPDGSVRRAKVLSSAALRGRVADLHATTELTIDLPGLEATPGLLVGFQLGRGGLGAGVGGGSTNGPHWNC